MNRRKLRNMHARVEIGDLPINRLCERIRGAREQALRGCSQVACCSSPNFAKKNSSGSREQAFEPMVMLTARQIQHVVNLSNSIE